MYPPERVAAVLALVNAGLSYSEIAQVTGLSRTTIRNWDRGHTPSRPGFSSCMVCQGTVEDIPRGPYAYLLGLYLSDGYIANHRRGVYRLRITCCETYPSLIAECALVMAEVLANRVGHVRRTGCTDVYSYSKHWPWLLPQHGPGHKHDRAIVLAERQRSIVDRFPAPFLRGLINADGCRVLNHVGGRAYPRDEFSNASPEIRGLCTRARDLLGGRWKSRGSRTVSVAKRASVQRLDEFIGAKP